MSDEENNIKKLLRSLVGPSQDLENALQQLLLERGVDTAIGDQLDVLGKLVGQQRGGETDDNYRRLIRARISVNRSKGTIADVLKVAGLVVNDPIIVLKIDNQGMAALVLRIEADPLPDATAALLIRMLRNTVAGGVRIIVEYSAAPVVDWLNLDVDNFDNEIMYSALSS